MSESNVSNVSNPNDLIHEAERILAATPQAEYAATREGYINEAMTRFGHRAAREVENSLPIGPLFLHAN
jgi:hypothetical protein